jgi:ferredoxin
MSMRVAVIGSGPTGLATALYLLSKGVVVELIDPWNEPIDSGTSIEMTDSDVSRIAKKLKFGSGAMYEYPNNLIRKETNLNYPLSQTIGGLSTVWGANVWFPEIHEIGLEESQNQNFKKGKDFILNFMPLMSSPNLIDEFDIGSEHTVPQTKRTFFPESHFLRSDNYIGSSILAVDKEKCISCGKCLSGCAEGAIYSAELKWRELVNGGKVLLHKGFAQSISKDMSIKVKSNSLEFKLINFDKIYIACGAIASTRLLQQSELVPDMAYLADTQAFYIPLLSLRKYQIDAKQFTLARMFFRSKDILTGLHISIYESSPEIVARAKSSLGFKGKLIPAIFWKQILAGIGFMPPEMSGRLKISRIGNASSLVDMNNKSTKQSLRKMLKKIRYDLLKARFMPIISSVQIPNVGSSYHVGSLQDLLGKNLISMEGRIEDTNNVYVVDSASLPRLPVGPITVAAMINAVRIAEISLNEA